MTYILLAVVAFLIYLKAKSVYNDRTRVGKVQGIELTWGRQGQQLYLIDGRQYSAWLDYKEMPKVGDTVEYTPYTDYSFGGKAIRAVKITKLG